MVDDTNSMPERPLTFLDVMQLTYLPLWLLWKIWREYSRAWWSGGATVNMNQTAALKEFANIGESKLTLLFGNGVTLQITLETPLKQD